MMANDVPSVAADWCFHLLAQINQQRSNDNGRCDTVLVLDCGLYFCTHSVILAASSPVLCCALTAGNKRNGFRFDYLLNIANVSSITLSHVLDFLYTGKLHCDFVHLHAVYSLATKLNIKKLMDYVKQLQRKSSEQSEYDKSSKQSEYDCVKVDVDALDNVTSDENIRGEFRAENVVAPIELPDNSIPISCQTVLLLPDAATDEKIKIENESTIYVEDDNKIEAENEHGIEIKDQYAIEDIGEHSIKVENQDTIEMNNEHTERQAYTPMSDTEGEAYTPVSNTEQRAYTPVSDTERRAYTPVSDTEGPAYTPVSNTERRAYTPVSNTERRAYTPVSDTVRQAYTLVSDTERRAYTPVSNTERRAYTTVTDTERRAYTPVSNTERRAYTPVSDTVRQAYTPVSDTVRQAYTTVFHTERREYTPVSNTVGQAYTPVSRTNISCSHHNESQHSVIAEDKHPRQSDKSVSENNIALKKAQKIYEIKKSTSKTYQLTHHEDLSVTSDVTFVPGRAYGSVTSDPGRSYGGVTSGVTFDPGVPYGGVGVMSVNELRSTARDEGHIHPDLEGEGISV